MTRKLKKYIRIIPGVIVLLTLFLHASFLNKNLGRAQANTNPKDTDKKDSIIAEKQNTDDNSFLFVDCTGFFE